MGASGSPRTKKVSVRDGCCAPPGFPADAGVLEACEPVYETLPGWQTSTNGVREWGALPEAARRYVERLSELAEVPVGLVSTGPDRADSIIRGQSAIASWFD
jgi:adenylosuccinate synthase